ncbi:hypothetical protein ScPMuIL_015235 [Solemya velum]
MACEDRLRETAEKVFKDHDKDGTGSLSKDELVPLISCLGYNVPEESAQKWFDSIDPDGDKQISFEEFLEVILAQPPDDRVEAALRCAFKEADRDGSGNLSKDELMDILQQLSPSGKNLEQIVEDSDVNNDGNISYEEFWKSFAVE